MNEHIAGLPPQSAELVSAFHVVEHISHDALLDFVRHAARVLQPHGLLILETPNPENVAVGTSNFYLDPTHQRPIPPPLLQFVVEQAGFDTVHVLRLNGEASEGPARTVEDVVRPFFLRAPDYAVVATRSGPDDWGVDFLQTVRQLGQAPPVDLDGLHAVSESLREMTDVLPERLSAGFARLDQQGASLGQHLERIEQRFEDALLVARERTAALEAEVQSIRSEMKAVVTAASASERLVAQMRSSRSWRATRPLRKAGKWTRALRAWFRGVSFELLLGLSDRCIRLMDHLLRFALRHPPLKRLLRRMAARWPRGRDFAIRRMRAIGLLPTTVLSMGMAEAFQGVPHEIEHLMASLPARSRALYLALQEDLANERATEMEYAATD